MLLLFFFTFRMFLNTSLHYVSVYPCSSLLLFFIKKEKKNRPSRLITQEKAIYKFLIALDAANRAAFASAIRGFMVVCHLYPWKSHLSFVVSCYCCYTCFVFIDGCVNHLIAFITTNPYAPIIRGGALASVVLKT